MYCCPTLFLSRYLLDEGNNDTRDAKDDGTRGKWMCCYLKLSLTIIILASEGGDGNGGHTKGCGGRGK